MRAACLLRLREFWRRGGPALLAAGGAVVFLVGLASGYGLASDLAATLGYVAAVLCGAFPLAIDRERRRSHLPAASPVTPWAWALGNGLGGGIGAAVAVLALFAAAGLGAAAGGGVETHVAHPVGGAGTIWLTPTLRISKLPADAHALRTEVRAYLTAEEAIGTPATVRLLVDGSEVRVETDQPVSLRAAPPAIEITNPEAGQAVGIAAGRTRVLGARRPFVANALLAGVGPALAAMALAALGVAAGAHLSAPVAALLAAVFLLLASLKGFLLETLEHEGKAEAAVAGEVEHGHDHGEVHAAPAAVAAAMRTMLRAVPDLPRLDTTDRVALGEWTGSGRALDAALFAAAGLLVAATIGGLGVRARRAP